MKRAALCMIVCLVLLCAACGVQKPLERYSHTFFGTFDTFVVLTAYTADKAAFDKAAELCESEFHRYHQLFDPYHHSKTQNNIYNLNEGAWKEPMQVDPDLMELLVRCRDLQKQLPAGVNIAMGRMLRLWHTARDDAEYDPYSAYIPDMKKLQDAAQHSSMDDVVLDEENT